MDTKMTYRKLEEAKNHTGNYGRASGLLGYTHAIWGVYVGERPVARLVRGSSLWEVYSNEPPYRRLAPRGYRTLVEAKAWCKDSLERN